MCGSDAVMPVGQVPLPHFIAWMQPNENMKPRDAAAIFNDLDMPVLLSVVGRMKEARAAAVLAAMSPDKAREVTTQLALTRTKAADAARNGETAPSVPPKPGGAGT